MYAQPFAAERGLHYAVIVSWLSGAIFLDQVADILLIAAPASRTSLGAVIRIREEVLAILLVNRRLFGLGQPLAASWLTWRPPQ